LAQAESATRQTILSAAYAVFTRNGFRGATMDDVAREARLARATLYTHFDGKTDLFRALAIRLVEAELAAARQALDSAAPVETRLIDILAAKIAPIVEINARSPHARELQDEFRRLGEDIHRAAWAITSWCAGYCAGRRRAARSIRRAPASPPARSPSCWSTAPTASSPIPAAPPARAPITSA
jgi:AcrR family transcriptional regulator